MSKVNARKRGKSWQYYFEGAKVDGKRQRIVKSGFETEKEALKAGVAALAEYNAGGAVSKPAEISVADFSEEWLRDVVEPNRAAATYTRYRDAVELRIRPAIGKFPLRTVTPTMLQGILTEMQKAGYRKSSMQFVRAVMSASFKWGHYPRKYLPENPAQFLTVPKAKVKPIVKDAIDVETFRRIVKAFPIGTNLHLPAIIAFYTGLRKSEVLGLTWDDVDMDKRTVTVRKQLLQDKRGRYYGELKTESSYRTVRFGEQLKKHLEREKSRALRNKVRLGADYSVHYVSAGGYILTGDAHEVLAPVIAYPVCRKSNGDFITKQNLDYCFRKVHKEMELPHVSFHTFRHTHATLLLERGANIKSVSERLGHSDVATTMEIYAHVTDDMETETASMLDDGAAL